MAEPAHAAKTPNASRQTPIKVSPAGDKLITSGANFLGMSKKDLVEEAVAFYLDARREDMQTRMRDLLRQLDGTYAARLSLLTGVSQERIRELGGTREDN
jgi:hypothetical protein